MQEYRITVMKESVWYSVVARYDFCRAYSYVTDLTAVWNDMWSPFSKYFVFYFMLSTILMIFSWGKIIDRLVYNQDGNMLESRRLIPAKTMYTTMSRIKLRRTVTMSVAMIGAIGPRAPNSTLTSWIAGAMNAVLISPSRTADPKCSW